MRLRSREPIRLPPLPIKRVALIKINISCRIFDLSGAVVLTLSEANPSSSEPLDKITQTDNFLTITDSLQLTCFENF